MDDLRRWVRQARERDAAAFDALVRHYRESALRYAHAILRDGDAAQDVVQEAFVEAYLHLPSLRQPDAFPVWLRAIVSHCASRLLRRKRVPVAPLDDIAEFAVETVDPAALELTVRVHDAIRQLPDHERVVTQLFYLEGYSQREIANLLRVPVTTINNRLHASRRRMKPRLTLLREPVDRPMQREGMPMLVHETTQRTLLKGDAIVTISTLTEDDLPAVRRLNDEIDAGIELANAQRTPGGESTPGGPWADDAELRDHFQRYQAAGNITLLAQDADGKLVGWADLWATVEPEPFGAALDVECCEYLWEYHHLGLETIFLQEAVKVAAAAGLPALDIGTNTANGMYQDLRRFGLRVFYESDRVLCRCAALKGEQLPACRLLSQAEFDPTGLLRVNHWAPTDFDFTHEPGRPPDHEFFIDGHRVIADFWRLWEPGQQAPINCELFAPPPALHSPVLMMIILTATATIAASLGAEELGLPYPSALPLEAPPAWVGQREFEWAWLRKRV